MSNWTAATHALADPPPVSVETILDGILDREKGFVANRFDLGGRTAWGISERDHPDLWTLGAPTLEQAKTRLRQQYLDPFNGLLEAGVSDRVRVCVIDDGVLSGVTTAVKHLQRALDVSVDGLLGPVTTTAAAAVPVQGLLERLTHQRVRHYAQICKDDPTQATFLLGWVDRAFLFL